MPNGPARDYGLCAGTPRGGIMAHRLLIDDDPALIPKLVRQVFPGPAHRVEVAGTGAEGLERVSACRRTSFSSTCACPTSPAWGSAGRSVARFGLIDAWH